MANDRELKALVDDDTHDDFLVSGRAHGFDNKSEYLRWVIKQHLYGSVALIKVNRVPGGKTGQE